MSLHDFTARLATTGIPWYVARSLSFLLAGNALVTGWDYTHTPPDAQTAKSLRIVEEIATLHTWGIAFLIAGGLLALGLIARRHSAVWFGHLICAGLNGMFAIATAQAVWVYAHSPLSQTQGSIWRAVTVPVLITTLHAALCYIRGPVPRKGDER